uniref:Fatty acyl-CoA reductase n=1 Tax=Kalanchoe fedtschenkoi TaxID=63787 RepID=A0A7N0UTZ5_KALFE
MGTLLTPCRLVKLGRVDDKWFSKRNQNNEAAAIKSSDSGGGGGASSLLTQLRANNSKHRRAALVMDNKPACGSLVSTPNGSRGDHQLHAAVMDLAPCLVPEEEQEEEEDNGLGIVRFLKAKNFLITGATGFLAKVLIEKILRTAPDVGKIYVLIKAKNLEAAEKRLMNEIVKTELLKNLHEIHGDGYECFMMSKLVAVVGDVSKCDVGLDQSVASSIANDVDVIVNSAANTTFDERYDIALGINTKGPRNLMTFAKRCNKLKLFVQVSTAYVNGERQGRVMEKPFSIGASSHDLDVEAEMKLADHTHPRHMKELGLERAKKYGWQDTYVFTKAMGEMVVDEMRGDIPVVVIRPSVIESTFKDPFPGWMEGNRMMDPIILYYGKGQLTGFLVNPTGVLDVVPADMVVNGMLAAMARHGREMKGGGVEVYQIASSVVNPLVFQDLSRLLYEHYRSCPCMDSRGLPIQVPAMKLFQCMDDFCAHIRQDAIKRSQSTASCMPRRLEGICKKSVEQAKHLANIYQPYTFYGGRFDNSNTERLMEMMSEEERKMFGFDVGSIKWEDYIVNVHIPGLRRHVMKGRGTTTTNYNISS